MASMWATFTSFLYIYLFIPLCTPGEPSLHLPAGIIPSAFARAPRALRFPCVRTRRQRPDDGRVMTAWCSERTKALISIEFASIYGSCAVGPPINPSEQPGAQQQRSRPGPRCRKANCCFRSWSRKRGTIAPQNGDSVAAMGTRAVMEAGAAFRCWFRGLRSRSRPLFAAQQTWTHSPLHTPPESTPLCACHALALHLQLRRRGINAKIKSGLNPKFQRRRMCD